MNNFIKLTFTIALLAICSLQVMGQQYDLLIKGGHVIDAKNNIDEPMDIAIKGDKIALVQKSIEEDLATQVIDATGLFVSPGLIDIHTHNFYGLDKRGQYSNGYSAIHPDGFTLPYGVTTVVDAGGSGWRNFIQFKELGFLLCSTSLDME